ncbi:MAG TPA: class I SAM-dependent methyltransferase [Microbacteriaceae bacterium]|jgi:SAM-dependent methyltransferase|nr:class I SAM-dependent methyltransferase [Microbacteriaceae bacterium]
MKQSLVPLLRSPVDGTPLDLRVDRTDGEEIVEGSFVDSQGTTFPIQEGVPLFAEAAAEGDTFGFKWDLIGDSYGHEEPSRTSRRQWYLNRFGFETEEHLTSFLANRPRVLDAGTGSGVDTSMFADTGATVVGVDLSRNAALSTYRRLGSRPNVHVVQADLLRLPFGPDSFDYISSDQVLHHTPDTAATLRAIARHLAPAGVIAIYVYNRKAAMREFADDFIRDMVTQMNVEDAYEVSKSLTLLGKALSEVDAKIDVPAIPVLGIEGGEEDVQRFVYWNMLKCFWNPEFDFELNVLVNFDWYHPKYAWRHTPEEVTNWFEELGFDLERLVDVQSGLSAVAARPV